MRRPPVPPRLPELLLLLLILAALGYLLLGEARQGSADVEAEALPSFSPPEGWYEDDLRVRLVPPEPDARVLFTLDGSLPTARDGHPYAGPLRLDAASGVTVVRARVLRPDGSLGPVATASYFVGLEASLPVVSLVVGPDDLWGPEAGIHAHPTERGRAWERPAEVVFVDDDRRSGFHLPAGVRIHGHQSRTAVKKSFRLYFRSEYGAPRLEYPLYADGEVASFKRLVLHNGGQDWPMPPLLSWTLMRNELAARLGREVGITSPRGRPVLLFVNGEAWGVYLLRERLDEHFLEAHFGWEEVDYLDSPESYLRETVLGDREHWDALLAYLEGHDLSSSEAYAYVAGQVDLDNFIDYVLIQIYAGNVDWPYHNVQQFRPRVPGGRWHWAFWDTDNGFAADGFSSPDTDLWPYLLHGRHVETGGRDTLLLRRLLENEGFRRRFLTRAAELFDSVLSPAAVTAQVDAMAAELAPDVAYEATRWPTPADWDANVEALRAFAAVRPDVLRRQFAEAFGLPGAYALSLASPAVGEGTLAVNGRLVGDLPWEGTYFADVPLEVTAVPAPGYRFAAWADEGEGASATVTVSGALPTPLAPRFERLEEGEPAAGDVVITAVGVGEGEEGDWVELRVERPGGVDLRGWRITDNDRLAARDEGSWILPRSPELARVPRGMVVRVTALPALDDPPAWRGLVLRVGEGEVDDDTDPWFNLTPGDNVAVLAPGASGAFADDVGIAFVSDGTTTSASFGILSDGVLTSPFPEGP